MSMCLLPQTMPYTCTLFASSFFSVRWDQKLFHHPEVLNPPISQAFGAPQTGFHQLNSSQQKSKLHLFANLSQGAFSNASRLQESIAVNIPQQGIQNGPGQRCQRPRCSHQRGKAGCPLWWLKQAADYSWGHARFSAA